MAESPPAGGTFFYAGDSLLFRHTQRAFAAAFGPGVPGGEGFLHFFRSTGCYLEDLCTEPINHLRGAERRRAHRAGVGPLIQRLSKLGHRPHEVAVVSRAIGVPVGDALSEAGLGSVPCSVLPFPAMSHQRRYEVDLAALLDHARREGWLRARAI